MKIELIETDAIKLIPETIQDKVWLTLFMRDMRGAPKTCRQFTELLYEKNADAESKGCGYADPQKVGVFDEKNGIEIDYSEISELTIYNHDI